MGEFIVKDLCVFSGGEITTLQSPIRDGRRDTPDELANTGLTLTRAERSMKILGCHDVGRRHRPTLRNLDILLLENDLTGFARDCCRPVIPFATVVRRDALASEISTKLKPLLGLGQMPVSPCRCLQHFFLHWTLPPFPLQRVDSFKMSAPSLSNNILWP